MSAGVLQISCQFIDFFLRRIAFCTNCFLLLLAGSFMICRGFPHVSFITFTSQNTYDISFQRNVLLILVNQVAELITLQLTG
jgi:hypothetical protein